MSTAVPIIGIDCATQPRKMGLARGVWNGRTPRVEEVLLGSDASDIVGTIADWLPTDGRPALLACDAPLGWPAPLGEMLNDHRAGDPVSVPSNTLFRRLTDRVTWRETGKLPLDVGADRIARTAHAALNLLQAVRERTGTPLPLAWDPALPMGTAAIEVYPAGTLTMCGIRSSGYKGNGGTAVRREILVALQPELEISCDSAPLLRSDDALDAAICILAGADFLRGATIFPTDRATVEREGWIWVRRPTTCPNPSTHHPKDNHEHNR